MTIELHGTWRLGAPPAAVWDVLADLTCWPAWWPAIREVRPHAPAADRDLPGSATFVFDAPAPLRKLEIEIDVVRAEPPHRMAVATDRGGFAGRGELTIKREPAWTAVRYRFDVRTTSIWMKPVSAVLRSAFGSSGQDRLHEAGDRLAALVGTEAGPHEP